MHTNDRETWWRRRVADLAHQVKAGTYWVPAEDIAHAMLYGRPKWGDDPVLVDVEEVRGSQLAS